MPGIISDASYTPLLPNQVVNGMTIPHDDVMAQMPWEDLQQLRNKAAGNTPAESAIAPYEHRAYARENVSIANPLDAAVFATLPPAYQAAKIAGLTPTDSQSTPPSFNQFVQGEIGVGEGLKNSLVNGVSNGVKAASNLFN